MVLQTPALLAILSDEPERPAFNSSELQLSDSGFP